MAETPAPTGAPQEPQAGHGRQLDDVMLAMDVVDTLRHNERLVERELAGDARDEQLVKRLREIYDAQGIEVPDHVLAEGVEALKQQRFVYEPPGPSFGRTLAKLYVKRAAWGWPLLIGLAVLVVLWGGYRFGIEGPREAARERQAIELSQDLPRDMKALVAEIEDLALVEEARGRARALLQDGLAAAAAGKLEAARGAEQALRALRESLAASYVIRIVSRPGESSGVWRIPDANPNARNYYLIVEAVDPKGDVLTLPVTSEEDGKARRVSKWGVRVSDATFEAVRADKSDDGIIQNNRLGVKQRGHLEPDYAVETPGGVILDW